MADHVSAAELTVSPVLKGVLALEELAGGVVSFTDAARIHRGLGAQNLVTAYFLSKEVAKYADLKSKELPASVRAAAMLQDIMDFSEIGATLLELRGSVQPNH